MITKLLFWACAWLVAYVYFVYPLLVWVLSALLGSRSALMGGTPSVCLLIAAHNEAAVVGAKIHNALSLDYPAEKLTIAVASDGSSDETAAIVRALADEEATGRIRLFDFAQNRGKIGALNEAIQAIDSEIVAFSDASTLLAADSIRRLAEHFADSHVGAVSGVYRVLKKDEAGLGRQEDFYWKYETFLKVCEANIGAFTGAHGSLYAIRRILYPFPAAGTINDDFIIPMRIEQKGYRIAYEPAAVAYEEAQEMEGFARRVRIMAGNIEQLREMRELIWPLRPVSLLCLLSHKLGRLLVPAALLLMLLASGLLWAEPLYRWFFLAQLGFYLVALLGAFVRLRPAFLRLPYYFCMINSAFFAWIYHAVRLGRLVPSRVELDGIGNQTSGGSS
ncbi:MAG: glycosyltransferase family 2 protein [Acidobacteria bacterium]|nr:glycosyltransferase family 2 protein [Acidobacteriota bacterium]